MYNILILSAGRRTKLVEYFIREFKGAGNVVATDCSEYAPALYIADKYHIVPRIDAPNYIEFILDICKEEAITGVFSLIDPELELLITHQEKFEEIGVKVISSNKEVTNICFDKYKMYEFCTEHTINTVKTFIDVNEVRKLVEKKKLDFPLFVKPRYGSASLGISKVNNIEDLEILLKYDDNLIIQEFMAGQEYGVDVYVDLISKEVVSIFIKKKLVMRAGETDKSISAKDFKLLDMIKEFVTKLNIQGQCDIDVFEKAGEYFISEVNPRFGGGYPHAYECGCNFPKYILNNLQGSENEEVIGKYEEDILMMKCDNVLIKK
ncbi:ATP-grasp domain-containing protein [Turicibacter sanguinis]|uniref:ATP-grasp domain-containing protein n=1 Tax=Turicibacter sanguinis TaxID=154288 RepID=UPI00189C2B2A|nr:ATP-grasp domain-containing protein [Turicibacter sanguinis]MDB8555541.1 ATP-grasp domain-containing protein [Turicibacter sanguinis]